MVRNATLLHHLRELSILHLFAFHIAPAVRSDLVAVNIGKDVRLVAPAIDVKLVEVSHEGVISPRLRRIVRIQVHPLLLYRFELGQVVEVDSSFARVATEKENTVLEGEAVGAGTRRWLVLVPNGVQLNDFLPIVRDYRNRQ